MSFILRAAALLVVSAPAFADMGGGCRCANTSLLSVAVALPILAVGVLSARRR